jgi:hypothetical protein
MLRGIVLLTTFVVGTSNVSVAAEVTAAVGRIVHLYTFTDFGNGDVVFATQSVPPTCQDGFWVRMTDPGAKTAVAQIMAAFHSGAALNIWASDSDIWSGSSGRFCRVTVVRVSSG